MRRDLQTLSQKRYDVVVIGGGIYGAFAAWDGALRGLSVALIEKGDFGGATSSNSLKIVHGGFRYLQRGDFKRMRDSIRERTNLMRIAPHLIHPLECIIPTFGLIGMKGRLSLKAALLINELVSFDKNSLGDPQKYIKRGHVISKESCGGLIDGLNDDDISGGAVWYDGLMFNSERLVLSILLSASSHGADLANYLEVVDIRIDSGRVKYVVVEDNLSGERFDIQASFVINAAGPWAGLVANMVKSTPVVRKPFMVRAMDLIVNKQIFGNYAVGIQGKNGKDTGGISSRRGHYFFVPWRDRTMIGTYYTPSDDHPDDVGIREDEVMDFIGKVNESYPPANLSVDDVTLYHVGLLPSSSFYSGRRGIRLEEKYRIQDHGKTDDVEGMISVYGVKYTTARLVVEKTLDLMLKKMGREHVICKTGLTPVYGGEIANFEEFLEASSRLRDGKWKEGSLKNLAFNHGSKMETVIRYAEASPDMAHTIGDSQEVTRGQIINGIREEMAQKLSDLVMRRTDLGSAGYPGDKAIEECALLAAGELSWVDSDVKREIEEVKKFFSPLINREKIGGGE